MIENQAQKTMWPLDAVEALWQQRVLPLVVEPDSNLFEKLMSVVRYAYPPPGWNSLAQAVATYEADHPGAGKIELEALHENWTQQQLPARNTRFRVAFAAFYTMTMLHEPSDQSSCWAVARLLVSQLLEEHRNANQTEVTCSQTYVHLLHVRKAMTRFLPELTGEQSSLDVDALAQALAQSLEEAIANPASEHYENTPSRQVMEILNGERVLGSVTRRRIVHSRDDSTDEPSVPDEWIRHAPSETNHRTRERHQARPEAVVTRSKPTQYWPRLTNKDGSPSTQSDDPVPSASTVKATEQMASWESADDNPIEDDPQKAEQVISELPVDQQAPARARIRKRRPLQRLRGATDVHRLKSGAARALLQSAQSAAELVFMTLCYLGRRPKEVEKLAIVDKLEAEEALKTLTFERTTDWLWMPIQGGPDNSCRVLISGRLKSAIERIRENSPHSPHPLEGLTKTIDQRGRRSFFRQLGGVTITAERLRAAGWLAVRAIAGNDMVTEVLAGQLRAATATDLAYRRLSNQDLQDTFDAFAQQLNLEPRPEPDLFELHAEDGADHIGSDATFDIGDALEMVDTLTMSIDSLKRPPRTLPEREYNERIRDWINRTTAYLYLLLSLCTASRPWGEQTANSQHTTRQGEYILHSEKASQKHSERRWLPLPQWLAELLKHWCDWVERWLARQRQIGWQIESDDAGSTVLPGRVRPKTASMIIGVSPFTHETFKRELNTLAPDSPAWHAYRAKSRGNALRHLVATRAQHELGATAQHWLLGHVRETDANLHWSSSRSTGTDERDIRRFQKAILNDVCPKGLSLPSVEDMLLREVSRG